MTKKERDKIIKQTVNAYLNKDQLLFSELYGLLETMAGATDEFSRLLKLNLK